MQIDVPAKEIDHSFWRIADKAACNYVYGDTLTKIRSVSGQNQHQNSVDTKV